MNKMLTLTLNGEVPLDDFAEAVKHFQSLISDLTQEVGGVEIVWVVTELAAGSASITVAPAGSTTYQDKEIDRVVEAFASVARAMQSGKAIPYKAKIGETAQKITQVINGHINSVELATSTEAFVVSVSADDRKAETTYSLGSITGKIEALNSRRALRFTLYDDIFDTAISCVLDEENKEQIRDAWGKRATITGMIGREPRHGRPIRIKDILTVEVLPTPSRDDAWAIFTQMAGRWRTSGSSTNEPLSTALHRMRANE